MSQKEIDFINHCKQLVLKTEPKKEPNLLGYLRTKDESLKDCYFYGDGILQIWLSKDNQTLYVRTVYPEPTQLVYMNNKENIEEINEAINYQFTHINSLLGKGFIDVYVCPLCQKEHMAREWDRSTLKPLEGRTVRGYISIMLSDSEYSWRYICPSCKKETLKKNLSLKKRELKG